MNASLFFFDFSHPFAQGNARYLFARISRNTWRGTQLCVKKLKWTLDGVDNKWLEIKMKSSTEPELYSPEKAFSFLHICECVALMKYEYVAYGGGSKVEHEFGETWKSTTPKKWTRTKFCLDGREIVFMEFESTCAYVYIYMNCTLLWVLFLCSFFSKKYIMLFQFIFITCSAYPISWSGKMNDKGESWTWNMLNPSIQWECSKKVKYFSRIKHDIHFNLVVWLCQ